MSKTLVEDKFSQFHARWTDQLDQFLRYLAAGRSSADYAAVADRLTAHHRSYFTAKWAAAREDTLAFYSAVWLTPLERAYLWITGWKPSMALRLVDSVGGLTAEQAAGVEALRRRVRMEEERVEREMERQQVSVAGREVVEVLRRRRRSGGGGCGNGEAVVAGLERVMKMGDCVRLGVIKGMMDLLSPVQCAVYMAALSLVIVRVKKWGR